MPAATSLHGVVIGAAENSNGMDTLRTFAAVIIIVIVALLLTTRLARRIQRIRIVAALTTSGWLAIGLGFLLGPRGVGMVQPETLLAVRPLLVIGLGWIGLIVGMQANWQLLTKTPSYLVRWTLWDTLLSFGVGAVVIFLFLVPQLAPSHATAGWLMMPTVLLACATIGWAPETRSLQDQSGDAVTALVRAIRAASGLASLVAVAAFGIAAALVLRGEEGDQQVDLIAGSLALIAAIVLAILAGLGSRSLLVLAHRDRSQTLVVFLGTITIVAGIATMLTISPVFAAMLVGVVISNLAGTHLRAFEWFILRAEHAVANIFFLLAGVLLEPQIGGWGWGIVGGLVVARLLFKPALLRRMRVPTPKDLWWGSTLLYAPLRQSPVAIALAVGLVVAESSPLNVKLLTVIVLVGLISELMPTGMSMIARRWARSRQPSDNDRIDNNAPQPIEPAEEQDA